MDFYGSIIRWCRGSKKCINLLPNYKIVDWSNLKASTDDKIYVIEKLKFVLERAENIMGKGENAGYHHSELLNMGIVW